MFCKYCVAGSLERPITKAQLTACTNNAALNDDLKHRRRTFICVCRVVTSFICVCRVVSSFGDVKWQGLGVEAASDPRQVHARGGLCVSAADGTRLTNRWLDFLGHPSLCDLCNVVFFRQKRQLKCKENRFYRKVRQ